jgi:outer membrane murein-binding lipoprotein Lpp
MNGNQAIVKLTLDGAQYSRALDKAASDGQKFARGLETSINVARAGFLSLGASAGAAVAVINQQAQNIAAFQGLAEQMGDTAEAVASIKLASDVSGVSLDLMAQASVKLTSMLSRVDDEGKGAGKAIKALGLEAESFKKLSPVDQIDAIAQALAGYEDGAAKTAVAVDLFGESGAKLIPLFNDLAGGAQRQITLTNEQIAAADAYTKQTAKLSSEIDTLVQTTAAGAIPALSSMVQMLSDVLHYSTQASEGISLLDAVLGTAKTVFETIIVVGSDVAFVIKGIGTEIGGMAAQLVALATLDISGFNAISKAMKEDAARARAELDKFQASILRPVTYSADDQSSAEARRLGLATGKRALNYAPTVTPTKVPKSPKLASTTSSGIKGDPLGDFAKPYLDRVSSMENAASRLYQSVLTPIEKLAAREAEIAKLRQGFYISDETAIRARMEAQDEYDAAISKSVEKVSESTKEAEDQAKRLGDAFSSTFDSAFKEGQSFGDLLKKLAYDAINIQFLTPAAQKAGKALGTIVSGLFGGARAGGGGVTAGTTYLVGEKGPELWTAPANGNIIPNHALGGMGGSSFTFAPVIDARGSDAGVQARIDASLRQAEARFRASIVPTVMAAANRGGGAARALGRA